MRARRFCLLLGAASAVCFGADQAPPAEFLEFLGTGSRMGTQWIDPMSLQETPEPFAGLTPVKKQERKSDRADQRPDDPPQKDTSAPPRSDDGGNEDD